MKRHGIVPLTAAAAVLLALAGCRKQQTTLEQQPPPPPVDTTFRQTEALTPIDTTDNAVFREAELEAEMQRKVAEILQPVYFEFNSYRLTQEAIERLVRVASFLTEYGTLRVLAEGHCDERGSSEYNMGLGENRARAVKEYLVNYGLPGVRTETTSYGEERLVRAGCGDEECHGMNRRVEFKVIGR
jgi:peptidoglycan-associated lipoprotein